MAKAPSTPLRTTTVERRSKGQPAPQPPTEKAFPLKTVPGPPGPPPRPPGRTSTAQARSAPEADDRDTLPPRKLGGPAAPPARKTGQIPGAPAQRPPLAEELERPTTRRPVMRPAMPVEPPDPGPGDDGDELGSDDDVPTTIMPVPADGSLYDAPTRPMPLQTKLPKEAVRTEPGPPPRREPENFAEVVHTQPRSRIPEPPADDDELSQRKGTTDLPKLVHPRRSTVDRKLVGEEETGVESRGDRKGTKAGAIELRRERPELPEGTEAVYAVPAPLHLRLVAWAIDTVIVLAFVFIYLFIASTVAGGRGTNASAVSALGGLDGLMVTLHAWERVLTSGVVLGLCIAVAYTAVCGYQWEGRTLGRRLVRIRLVDESGLAPSRLRSMARAALSVLSWALMFGGYWLALFDRRGQTLHDKLTSTYVVRP